MFLMQVNLLLLFVNKKMIKSSFDKFAIFDSF